MPGAEAISKKALKVFGEQAATVLEQLGEALVSGLISGGNVGVLIPQLVNDGVKDLAPELVDDGKNVLYGIANLALAEATESGTAIPAATVSGTENEAPADAQTPIGAQASGVQVDAASVVAVS